MYAYDQTPLDAKPRVWTTRMRIGGRRRLVAAYNGERIPAYLYCRRTEASVSNRVVAAGGYAWQIATARPARNEFFNFLMRTDSVLYRYTRNVRAAHRGSDPMPIGFHDPVSQGCFQVRDFLESLRTFRVRAGYYG